MAMKRTIDFHLNHQRKKANLYKAIKNDLDNNDSSSDEEPINISSDLYPLSHYVNDPEQLIQQLFSVVHGKRLARLIPPELKDMSFEELKTDCLIQLLCMSKKRILATLEGREMESSSNSDDSVDNQRKQILKAEKNKEISIKRPQKEKKRKSLKKQKVVTETECERKKSEEKEEKGQKTLLEILELEMKAKAIRALLAPNQIDNNTQIEEAIKNEIVTETKNESSSENTSWNKHYEEKEDVKEVVKTSKLCTNMRRRMLLHQQKMLADRAKLKAEEEAKNVKSGVALKTKVEENLLSNNIGGQSNTNVLEKESNNAVEESCVTCGDNTIIKDTDNDLQGTKEVNKDVDIKKSNKKLNNPMTTGNNTSTDDDSQKSIDFESVLNEYSQKNADLEIIINEYSQKNTDLRKEINKCSENNDNIENTMNSCAQKNSDIELAINDFSLKNHNIDKDIMTKNNEKTSDSDLVIEKSPKKCTNLNSLIGQKSKQNIEFKSIVDEYSKRNSEIMALMGEYSQNNIDIQSVINDYVEGNHKLESIIDEYSDRNAKIKNMINEYSVNNCNVEKLIDQNSRKQLLVNKYNIESATGKSSSTDKNIIEEKNSNVNRGSSNLDIETNSMSIDKPANNRDKMIQ